tara:strand:+ start:954 stop:1157 length:204 start_codon:yes stop_codon:yes gene_type:complete
MERLQTYTQEINRLTSIIETEYPELYIFLNENPITIPSEIHPDIDLNIMKDYLESLKILIEKYIETR